MLAKFLSKTSKMAGYEKASYTGSLDHKVGQKVRSCRLAKRYTQKDLAEKIGTTRQVVLQYEKVTRKISIKKLYALAEALSTSARDLVSTVSKRYFENEGEEILNLVRRHKEIKDQELRKKLYPLIRFIYVSEKINQEEARLEIAKNLVKEGVSTDIICQVTRLSIYEYDDTEKEIYTDSILYKVGKRIKEQRLVRGYTQEDLANKIGSTPKEINNYEQGYIDIPIEILGKVAKTLSINIKALFLRPIEYENEDGKTENKLLRFIDECKDQESRDIVGAVVRSLSEGMKTNKEQVKKVEKIKVAKDLVKAGIAIDIISQASGLSTEAIAQLEIPDK